MAQSHTSFTFTATTTSPGFDDDQVHAIVRWARLMSDSCMIVEETTTHRHLHGVFRVPQKQTGQVTRKFHTLYSKLGLEWVTGVSVKVKKTTELIGWFHYMLKDQTGPPLCLTGWSMQWITEQCQAAVKKIPRKILEKDQVVLSSRTAVPLIIAFAAAQNLMLCDKGSFIEVVVAMQADKYNFQNIKKKGVFEETMAQCGQLHYARQSWENELQFLG